jgi:DNA-binding GntR family transcriptional regulator
MTPPLQDTVAERPKRWTFDRRLPLAEQVYDDLRRRIVALELQPDHSLSRQELSAYYGVSQTPLRDAIQRLESESLVEIYPQSRTVVTRIDTSLVRETQFMRTALEVEIVALLAVDEDKSKLIPAEEVQEGLRRTVGRNGPFEDFTRLDKEFHRALYAAADMAKLSEMVDARSGQLDRIRRLHLQLKDDRKSEQVAADHDRILAALLKSDVEEAKAAMRLHLSGTVKRLDTLRARFPDFFA